MAGRLWRSWVWWAVPIVAATACSGSTHQSASTSTTAASAPTTIAAHTNVLIEVVVAAKDVPAGAPADTLITLGLAKPGSVTAQTRPVGALTDLGIVKGEVTKLPLVAGQVLTIDAFSPPAGLNSYVAAHRQAVVHSSPVPAGASMIAVVGLQFGQHNHRIAVISVGASTANELATITLPEPSFDFASDLPVQVADVTGDGTPDFLVRLSAADNAPGVVVSNDGGAWRPVHLSSSDPTNAYAGRDPTFTNGRLLTRSNDCIPNCAQGHTTTQVWRYDKASRVFVTS